MIIFAKIRLSIDYKVFILLNVHPAKITVKSTRSFSGKSSQKAAFNLRYKGYTFFVFGKQKQR